LGREGALELLIPVCDIDARDSLGWTALHLAVVRIQVESVRELLAHGADPNVVDREGRTALFLAVERSSPAIVEILIEVGDRDLKPRDGRSLLAAAMMRGHDEVATLLVNIEGWLDLSPDSGGRTPVHHAAQREYIPGLTTLCNFQERARAGRSGPANLADEWSPTGRVSSLLHECDREGRTALSVAAEWGRIRSVELLLGQSPESGTLGDIDGWLPLHYAVAGGHADLMAMLAPACDPDSLNGRGETPLQMAVKRFDRQTSRALLLAGASLAAPGARGETALMTAAQVGHVGFIEEIFVRRCEFEFDIDQRDERGWTLAHYAARVGNREMRDIIVRAGCDLTIVDNEGYTPRDLIAYRDRQESGETLRRRGGRGVVPDEEEDGEFVAAERAAANSPEGNHDSPIVIDQDLDLGIFDEDTFEERTENIFSFSSLSE
jgi:ankyrin repeat protein